MPRQLLLEGPAIEPLLRQVRDEHGESARVLKAERVRVGGVGGFFAKEKYEVTFEVDDSIAPRGGGGGAAAEAAPTSAFGATVPGERGATPRRQGSAPGAPRGLAALLAAAEQAERAAVSAPEPDDSSPSTVALAAVREALASRAPVQPPISTEKPAFTEVLASVRTGLEGGGGHLAVPDDARTFTGDPGGDGLPGEGTEDDAVRASALEQLRRALDALGVVDDTHDPEEAEEAEEVEEVQEAEGLGLEDDAEDTEDERLPDDEVWAEEVDDARDDEDGADDEPHVEEQPRPPHAVSLLQEMPRELVERDGADGVDGAAPSEPIDVEPEALGADVPATSGSADPPPMTRRERRRAEEAERAAEPLEELLPAEEDHVSVDDVPSGELHEPSGDAFALPSTLDELGEPHPHEPLPELPSVPAELMAAAALAAFRAAAPEDDASDAPHGDDERPEQAEASEPEAAPEQPEAPPAPETPPAPPAALHDRLARLGLHDRWLSGLPDEQGPALRVIAERLSALDVRPRRTPRASDHPVVAVLAEGTGAGLETARTLALSLGLRADQVVALAAEDRRTARPGAEPLDRAAAARAAHAGRRRAQPVVVLVPVPFTPTPGERGAAAAALAALDADQVWAVVDATRRTSDAQAWLRAVGPAGGVDAVALVGLAATTAPADALELGAPVVLLDGRPATAVDWVATLAAHLTREDVEAHLAGLDRSAGPVLGVEA